MTNRTACSMNDRCRSISSTVQKITIVGFLVTLVTLIAFDALIPAVLVGAVGKFALVFYMIRKEVKNNPNQSTGPETVGLYTISETPHLSFVQTNQPPPLHHHHQPSPQETHTNMTPPTNRPQSIATVSMSAQLSHAYYTESSTFSSLSPYIASMSVEGWHHTASFSPRLETASQSPPTYVEVVDNDIGQPLPPTQFHTTSAANGRYREVFGPSSDELPSYEAVVAMRQLPSDDPPPYSLS